MSVGDFAFLPNLRGLAAGIATRDGARLVTSYTVQVTGDGSDHGAPKEVPATLRGPGDVIGVVPDQIVRTEPEPGLRGFEPNYMPFLEFRDADFPWRYSLDQGTGQRTRPWLVLIALRDEEFAPVARGDAPTAQIMVHSVRDSLPPLATAWATAHAQVDMNGMAGTDPADVLAADPSRGFSRLICPRALDPGTWYTLFLVPSYLAGIRAGRGEDIRAEEGAAPAWADDDVPLILPQYFSLRFRTETGQSLEALLEKLRAIRADEADEAGAPRIADTAALGYYVHNLPDPVTLPLSAALQQPGDTLSDPETPVPLQHRIANTLNRALEAEAEADEDDGDGEDPLLTFPAYGARILQAGHVSPQDMARGHWFDRLNLDLKLRAAAGLGLAVVAANQDRYARLCWDQYEEIVAANQQLLQLHLATALAGRMDARHFAKVGSETALRLAAPILDLVAANGEPGGRSIGEHLRRRGVPSAWMGRDMARQSARRPVKTRGADRPDRRRSAPPMPGDHTPSDSLRPQDDSPVFKQIETHLAEGLGMDEIRGQLGRMFNPEMLNRKPRPDTILPPVGGFRSEPLHRTVSARLKQLPRAKAAARITGRTAAEEDAGGPIFRAPRLPLPLINDLRPVDRQAILSGVGQLPGETVSVYEENRAFIESFMTGANHAMSEELRWRGFPTDMRGTIFTRFWDRGAEPDDATADDIGPIRDWEKPIGRNPSPADSDGRRDLVVVIKGDVIRKLDTPLITINVAPTEIDPEDFDPTAGQIFAPVYHGKIGRDVVYFGFDVARDWLMAPARRDRAFLAIHEPPGRLRFGLDVGSVRRRWDRPSDPAAVRLAPAPPLDDWDDLSWAHMGDLTDAGYIDFTRRIPAPPGSPQYWGRAEKSGATLARSFWQKPLVAVLPLERVL